MSSSASPPRPPGKRPFVPPATTSKPLGRLSGGGYSPPTTPDASGGLSQVAEEWKGADTDDRGQADDDANKPLRNEERPSREEIYKLRDILCAIQEPREKQKQPRRVPQNNAPAGNNNYQEGRPSAADLHRQQTASALLEHLRNNNVRAVFKWLVPSTYAAVAAAEAEAAAAAPEATAIDEAIAARHNDATTSKLAQEEALRHDIAAHLPPLLFSEFLRCVDPYAVYEQCDPAQDIGISPGLAQFTPLASQVDRYGRRKVYVALLRALVKIFKLRKAAVPSSQAAPPVVNDYVVLLRAAGAASDMPMAKRVWHEMEGMGLVADRQGAVYAEFVRARFLTERLYTQMDPVRLRVRPANLHRQKTYLPARAMHVLDRLRLARERHKQHRFGQNPHRPHSAEHLTRTLRKTRPLARVLRKTRALGYAHSDERLLAAAIIAYGRSGSAVAIYDLLRRAWGVSVVEMDGGGRHKIAVRGGYYYAPDSPMRPTAVLLDAVVQALCGMSRVACALQLVGHLARRYGIAVPDRVWFDLLGWAYAMSTKPLVAEWETAGFPICWDDNMVMRVWVAMTSAPFHVQPGFDQYGVLIKTLLHAGALDKALELMRRVKAEFFAPQLLAHEHALMAYAETARQNVHLERATAVCSSKTKRQHAASGYVQRIEYARHRYRALDMGPVTARLERVATAKWHMWYSLQTWCWALFKQLQDYKCKPRRVGRAGRLVQTAPTPPATATEAWYESLVQTWRRSAVPTEAVDTRFDDPFLVRTVPDIVRDFRPFLFGGCTVVAADQRRHQRVIGSTVEYSLASGTVRLREMPAYYHAGQYAKFVRAQETVDLPALRPHVNFTLQKKRARARLQAAEEQLAMYGGYGISHGGGGDGGYEVYGIIGGDLVIDSDGTFIASGFVSVSNSDNGRVSDGSQYDDNDYKEETDDGMTVSHSQDDGYNSYHRAGNAKQMQRDTRGSPAVVIARLDEGYSVSRAPIEVSDACSYDSFDAVCSRQNVVSDDSRSDTKPPPVPPGPPPRDVIVTNKTGHEVVLEQENGMHLYISEGRRWNDRLYLRTLLRRRTIWVRRPVQRKVDLQTLGRTTPRAWLVREFG